MLAASIAGAAALSLPAVLRGFAATPAPSPAQTDGPFYPLKPPQFDSDLVMSRTCRAAQGT
jgi:hypothetical protein